MLTPIKINNRVSAFLGGPAGGGKRPAVIHLHKRYGIVRHAVHQERSLWRFVADGSIDYDFTRMKRYAPDLKLQISYASPTLCNSGSEI